MWTITEFLGSIATSLGLGWHSPRDFSVGEHRHRHLQSDAPLLFKPAPEVGEDTWESFSDYNEGSSDSRHNYRCPFGIRGWDSTRRNLVVPNLGTVKDNNNLCTRATQAFMRNVIEMAPYSETEKSRMPWANLYIFRPQGGQPLLLRDLLDSTQSFDICGFGTEQNGFGYVTFESATPCEHLADFTATLKAARETEVQRDKTKKGTSEKSNTFANTFFGPKK